MHPKASDAGDPNLPRSGGTGSPHLLIVEARFYEAILDELFLGAAAAIEAAGGSWERITVPGALEIPAAIRIAEQGSINRANRVRRIDGYVALGCVIRGETSHFDYVCGESARGLMDLGVSLGLAVGNGILTVENEDQAWARANRHEMNKGAGAAAAALALIDLRRRFGVAP
ncbi:6,7-dimethyl-8-ribityllumazine synthase [Zavarzinia compransoris]|uniref:6,7-dimethyl-8-ribityllumazine synthase n=1 Tax=Zavarzinia compransoris TaxID=1264899 RepID=A0A317EAY7_9PROT|nr:6,7-dimethyl-8-ribityllumazine synthase [Zavarzinia compransoris]PWR23712.1 6,7-dimethyl-8-ribityllumazine synthase [Zavarzinia compransoris]TDP47936.1 6,7-dimethyl-8-ribityllumazine synthase [Zavarzinia compransoris]